jgi:hypothetical protein
MKSVTTAEGRKGQRRASGLCRPVAIAVLFTLALVVCGCRYAVKAEDTVVEKGTRVAMAGSGEELAQPGESEAEGQRRHQRVWRLNRQMLLSDLDKALLLDRPSKLTDKRIP